MRKLFSVMCLYLFYFNGFSQWITQFNLPKENNYYNLEFKGNLGITVCTNYSNGNFEGKIFRTTDAGFSWSQVYNFNNNILYSVYFMNIDTIYVGGQNYFLISNDSGITWSLVPNYYRTIKAFHFSNNKNGFIVGNSYVSDGPDIGLLMKTKDSGLTWSYTNTFLSEYTSTNNICFPDSSTGYVVGSNGLILKTFDGGTNWQKLNSNITSDFYGLYFINNEIGFITSNNGHILKTTNGGQTWNTLQYDSTCFLRRIVFTSDSVGYISSTNGTILKTTDSGTNWLKQESHTTQTLRSISFTDMQTGYILGDSGLILKTTNGGNSFINLNDNILSPITCYPNPFSKTTTVQYYHLEKGRVSIHIYDFSGKLVETMVNTILAPDDYNFYFDGTKHSTGIYYYCVKTETQVYTGKLVLCE